MNKHDMFDKDRIGVAPIHLHQITNVKRMEAMEKMMKEKIEAKEEGKIICERRWEGRDGEGLTCNVTHKAVLDDGREYNIHTIQWGKLIPKEIVEQEGVEKVTDKTEDELKNTLTLVAGEYIDWFVRENCYNDGTLGVKGTLIIAEEVKK